MGIQDHLQHAQSTTSKVQQDVADAPAGSALPSVVHQSLWHVLYNGDGQLDVTAVVQKVQPVDDGSSGQTGGHNHHHGKDCQDARCVQIVSANLTGPLDGIG